MDMDIFDLAKVKKLFGGGGGRTGTAIPADETGIRIFFNHSNTITETNAILSKLTFVQTPFLEYPVYLVYANFFTSTIGAVIVVINLGGEYIISVVDNVNAGSGTDLYNSLNGNNEGSFNGWNELCTDLGNALPQGILPGTAAALTDFNGIPVGAENEKIKNVISVTPF